LTIESLLISRCGKGHEPPENSSLAQVSGASSKQKYEHGPKQISIALKNRPPPLFVLQYAQYTKAKEWQKRKRPGKT